MDLIQAENTSKQVKKEFSQVREFVLKVLAESERSRNSDQWLIFCVLQKMGEDIKVEYDKEKRKSIIIWHIDVEQLSLASFETITRCRREIQNHPKHPAYLPTDPQVAAKRGIREEAVRDYYARSA